MNENINPFDQTEFDGENNENTLVSEQAVSQSMELVVVQPLNIQKPRNDAMSIDGPLGIPGRPDGTGPRCNQVGFNLFDMFKPKDPNIKETEEQQAIKTLSAIMTGYVNTVLQERENQKLIAIVNGTGLYKSIKSGKGYKISLPESDKMLFLTTLNNQAKQLSSAHSSLFQSLLEFEQSNKFPGFFLQLTAQLKGYDATSGKEITIQNKDKSFVFKIKPVKIGGQIEGQVGILVELLVIGVIIVIIAFKASPGFTAWAKGRQAQGESALVSANAQGAVQSNMSGLIAARAEGKITEAEFNTGMKTAADTSKTIQKQVDAGKKNWTPWLIGGGLLAASAIVAYLGRNQIKSKIKSASRSMIQQAANKAMDRVSEF
jgi:hypothetical protein